MNGLGAVIGGERVLLLPHKALYWPRERLLAVADVHFGKAAAFRAHGVPVPHGTTMDNLAALDAALAAADVAHLVFLGDFLHARAGHAATGALLAWRRRHAALRITVVRGNHDRHAGDPAAPLALDVVDEPYCVAPFAFCHHPDFPVAGGHVIAGHVHPVYRLSDGRDVLRLPCFVAGEHRTILPAFGAFTGGHALHILSGDRVFVVGGDGVFSLRKINKST
jgi:DNA ligase-associated metallophosphoesterase